MDDNKRLKLVEIGYSVNKCCGVCHHGVFKVNNDFGDCLEHDYTHLKHTGGAKLLSVFRYGGCSKFKMRESALFFMHAFKEFV